MDIKKENDLYDSERTLSEDDNEQIVSPFGDAEHPVLAQCASLSAIVEPLINNDDNDNDAEMANNEPTTTTTTDNKDGDDTERKPKRSPNRLMVDDVSEVVQGDGDNSCVLLSVCKMEGKALHIHNTSYLSTDAKSHHDTKKRIYRIEQSNQRLQQQQMTDVHCVCVCVVYN
eukprot:472068_1